MIEDATSETFAPHVGERFEVTPAEGPAFELELVSCVETPAGTRESWIDEIGRVPFSLVFRHPGHDGAVPQDTMTVRHPELGEFPLFLVPIGPGDGGMRYEAVIS